MANNSYLDNCKNVDEKVGRLLKNLSDIAKFQNISEKDLCEQTGMSISYLGQCKKKNRIDLGALLKMCDILGITLNKLMNFNYENLVRVKQLDEHKKTAADLREKLRLLDLKIKEEEKAVKVFQNS